MTFSRFLKVTLALPLAAGLLLPVLQASAQDADAQYCGELYRLARKYVAGSCSECAPDLGVEGARADCQKGNYASGISYLEKRLRDKRVTVPPRS